MFRRIEANDYRCLKEVSQPLKSFEILVGPNASGKSTFLDVVAFLGDFVRDGLENAVAVRTTNFHDLVWGREGTVFTLAVEAPIPKEIRGSTNFLSGAHTIRYELSTLLDTETETLQVRTELAELRSGSEPGTPIIIRTGPRVQFRSESVPAEHYKRDQQHKSYSSLTGIPSDSSLPTAAWLRELLREGIQTVVLDTRELQKSSPPGRGDTKRITGGTLARSVAQLSDKDPARFRDWIAHIRTALPDVETVRTVLKEEDKHRYVMVHYKNGVQVPSWMVSEGTLRLLALTILAYLPDFRGVYLVEEPENCVHPTALETIYQSLSSVYDAQVLVATHSPMLLNMASPDQILCFSKTAEGAEIVRGSDHPALQEWRREVSLGTLAASGILG
jgi:predicted ATPase